MSSQMFPKLLPVDIKFFGGESPSPQKLTGIYNYIGSAFFIIESFLGNGVDLNTGLDTDRKLIFNLSAALGAMGNVYKPVNYLCSLEYLHRSYGAINDNTGALNDPLTESHTDFKKIEDPYMAYGDEKYLIVRRPINIPIDIVAKEDMVLGFEATGKGIVSVVAHGGVVLRQETLSDTTIPLIDNVQVPQIFNINIAKGLYISHITITPDSLIHYDEYEQIQFYSLYLVSKDGTRMNFSGTSNINKPYNVAYAMNQDNPAYWKVARACTWAIQELCDKATCKFCIGNTYDVYTRGLGAEGTFIGEPVCGGNFANNIAPALQPKKIGDGTLLTYTPDNSPSTAALFTLQSPILMISSPYAIRLSPYAVHNLESERIIDKNAAIIYDSDAGGGTLSPIKYNLIIQSAGRPDIVMANDTRGELVPSNKRYMVLGAQYSVSSFIADTVEIASAKTPRTVSVYAD